MKKFVQIALLCGAMLTAFSANAQYSKGDLNLNAGFAFGLLGYSYQGNHSGFLPLTANLEYSLDDRFAVGPYLGYFSRTYKYNNGWGNDHYSDRLSVLSFGVRGTLHATSIVNDLLDTSINEEKFDLYGSLLLGYEVYSWNYDDAWGEFEPTNQKAGRAIFGPVLGVRYHFNPKIGAYFEGGRGTFGVGTLGVTFKF